MQWVLDFRTTRNEPFAALATLAGVWGACMIVLQNQVAWASAQVRVKDSMFFEEGKEWGRSRRLISPNLNGHNVAAMLPIMAKVTSFASGTGCSCGVCGTSDRRGSIFFRSC